MSNPNPTTLEEIIKEACTQLMIASHVLGCASVAIEHDRSPAGAAPTTMRSRRMHRVE
jgi:hypothetical protein